MLDRDGYRPNVGIILCNGRNEVFWGKRVKEHSWQFPRRIQAWGNAGAGDVPRTAGEVGLLASHVKILGGRALAALRVPAQWLKRDLARQLPGAKQIWFLLRLVGRECDVRACVLRTPRIRCLALERLLEYPRLRNRFQARVYSTR